VGYVHYNANNSIAPVVINGTGVGEYSATHIEAENFMRLEGGARKAHQPHRADAIVVEVHSPSTASLHYPRVHLVGGGGRGGAAPSLWLSAAASASEGGSATVTARRGAASGPALATCTLAYTGGAFTTVHCPLALGPSEPSESIDVVLTFDGSPLQLDSWGIAGL